MRFVPGCIIAALAATITAAAVWLAGKKLTTADAEQSRWLERRLSESVADGRDILFPAQVDEATLRWFTAERLKAPPEIAVFGSSHGLQISSAFAEPYHVANFCISGGSLPDHLVTTYVLQQAQRLPRVSLVFVDPWYFNAQLDFLMWRARPHQLSAMEATLAEGGPAEFPRLFRDRAASLSRPKLRSHYSLDPLINAADQWVGQLFENVVETKVSDGLGTVLAADGSIQPAGNRREISEHEARALALRQFAQNRDRHRYGIFNYVDNASWLVFERWVGFLQRDGARVVFILSPYHPAIYQRAVQSPNNHLKEVEARLVEFAKRVGAPVLGSYDPAKAGVNEAQFVDGDHLREEGLAKVLGTTLTEIARATLPASEPLSPTGRTQ